MGDSKSVRFFTMSQFHNKNPVAGSTFLRVDQLIKYWPEAGLYKYGENPDVLIFQKVYCSPDYKFPAHFPNKKILDICDPDWMSGMIQIKETIDAVDAVTCPTEALAKFLSQMTDKPVRVIKDRFDLEVLPKPKRHTGKAKQVVWFGYSHNAEVLRPALSMLKEYDLKLMIISDDDPMAWRWGTSPDVRKHVEKNYTYKKYQEDTIYDLLQQSDFALLPKGSRPIDKFKSENKTVKAQLAGLPVVYDIETAQKYLYAEERNRFVDEILPGVKKEYDVRNSVSEYKKLISEISDKSDV